MLASNSSFFFFLYHLLQISNIDGSEKQRHKTMPSNVSFIMGTIPLCGITDAIHSAAEMTANFRRGFHNEFKYHEQKQQNMLRSRR
jgi:hypothetical protein